MDLFQTLAAQGSRSLQAALLATKSLRFNLLLQEYQMTDLIKALRERREELHAAKPLFQHLRLFNRRLRNVSQRPNVSQLRSNSRSTDRPHSHGLTRG